MIVTAIQNPSGLAPTLQPLFQHFGRWLRSARGPEWLAVGKRLGPTFLIGVVLGPLVGTKMRWRKDPDLMRAYKRASWPWAVLNLIRTALLILFIDGNNLWALAASGAFFYGLTVVTIVISWRLIKGALPDDHGGIRHPRIPA